MWIHSRLLNAEDVYRWLFEAGVRKAMPPEELHFTQMTVREPVAWGDLQLRGVDLEIPAGVLQTQIFAYTIKALTFSHEIIRARHEHLSGLFPQMDHPVMRPHLSLYKGGRMPHVPYEGRLVFGPEIAEVFDAENTQGIKHIKVQDQIRIGEER